MRKVALFLVLALAVAGAIAIAGAVARDDFERVESVAASLSPDGSVVTIEVPHDGGCAARTHRPHYRVDGGQLVVWVDKPVGEFSCLAGCLDASCTEAIILRLDEPVAAGTPIVLGSPGPALLSGSLTVIIAIAVAAALVAFLWPAIGSLSRLAKELAISNGDIE